MEHTSNDTVEKLTRQSLDNAAKSKNTQKVIIWFAAMLIGGILGMLELPLLRDLFNFIATVFTKLFQFVAVPVISLAVITTLAELGAKRETGKIFGHAVFALQNCSYLILEPSVQSSSPIHIIIYSVKYTVSKIKIIC